MIEPIGIYLGDGDDASFGMLHVPDEPRATAVVVVPPLGYEAICAHRVLRCLAERLTARGFWVLRLDLPGTGDSAGDALDPDRVESWVRGIRQAIDSVREQTGAGRVVLVGLRAGALLSLAAASGRSDVSSLVLWALPKNGREWVRELRALSGLSAASGSAEDTQEVAGFAFSPQTLAEICALEARELPPPESARVLVVPRDDLDPPRPSAFGAWMERAELVALPGYADAMRDPHESSIDVATLEAISDFVDRAHPELGTRRRLRPRQRVMLAPSRRSGARVIEESVRFGEHDALFGIVTEPTAPSATPHPAVLWLNPGAIHRVGMNRNHTRLCRELARMGWTSLRFDISGLGDSAYGAGSPADTLYSPRVVPDVRQAMDFLARTRGVTSFVLAGLCSGAYASFHTALSDERVSDLVLINPQTFAYRTGDALAIERRQSFKAARWYRRAAFDPGSWKKALSGQVRLGPIARALAARLESVLSDRLEAAGPPSPERQTLAQGFERLLERGSRVLMIYSSDDPGLDYLRHALGPELGRLRRHPGFLLSSIDGPDHTFTPLWSQEALATRIKRHLSRPSADGEPSSLERWARRGAKQAVALLVPSSYLVVRGPRARRRIALTFDDGPTELTGAYLDVLRRHRARATFFLVGRCCERLPAMADAIAEHGHQIGGHGFTHRAFPEIAGKSLLSELEATQALLPKVNGHRPCVRPPHGDVSVASLVECARAGFTTVLWSWDSGDSRAVSMDDILLGFESRPPRAGDILLLHEDQRHTLEALPTLLERLAAQGYELCTVDELLRSPAGT